ncbi:MAG TPA: hypothetical protein VGY97_05485 [Solirubrobacteraceae bacterium]|nr:hypothetical protein [Solirubrobacteraceae bacterium]
MQALDPVDIDSDSSVRAGESPVGGDDSPVRRTQRFVRKTRRFMRAPRDPSLHEERGLGWRASWREGAEKLVIQREPERTSRKARVVPRAQ